MSKRFNYIVYDCETGGLDCTVNPITEIALVAVDNIKFKELKRYTTFVRPYADLIITPDALSKSLVKMSDIENGIDSKKLVNDLIEFFKSLKVGNRKDGRPIMLGHNNQDFDDHFLEILFALHDKNIFEYVRMGFDTLKLSHLCWNEELANEEKAKYSLTACCERAGIRLTNAHSAMNDTLATLKLFINLSKRMRSRVNKIEVETEEVQEKSRNYFQF